MQERMSSDVAKMRNQVMSFTNEGAEFQLNVPDTNEVKEEFSKLGKSRALVSLVSEVKCPVDKVRLTLLPLFESTFRRL